jgi:cytochrome c oxidase subunit 2
VAGFQLEKGERLFLYATIVLLVAFFMAILASIGEAGIHLPTDEGQVDPNKLRETAPFDRVALEDADEPTFINEDGRLEAVLIAKAYAFEPNPITVPAGQEIEFVVSSQDVIHGFLINDVGVNAMVIPGQITRVTATFDEPGEYNMICHEFCGVGHQTMFATVVVEEVSE